MLEISYFLIIFELEYFLRDNDRVIFSFFDVRVDTESIGLSNLLIFNFDNDFIWPGYLIFKLICFYSQTADLDIQRLTSVVSFHGHLTGHLGVIFEIETSFEGFVVDVIEIGLANDIADLFEGIDLSDFADGTLKYIFFEVDAF